MNKSFGIALIIWSGLLMYAGVVLVVYGVSLSWEVIWLELAVLIAAWALWAPTVHALHAGADRSHTRAGIKHFGVIVAIVLVPSPILAALSLDPFGQVAAGLAGGDTLSGIGAALIVLVGLWLFAFALARASSAASPSPDTGWVGTLSRKTRVANYAAGVIAMFVLVMCIVNH